ncbi:unnamed protein product [Pleuronectes platessa]|uniref:Uncharacterized protein n=1 Tax=Pleuronectes platessa TaxID=8262 RepID=A0A9N7U2C5_PLEPL|nr:unnamed protein product [Pleuronectes platessa]
MSSGKGSDCQIRGARCHKPVAPTRGPLTPWISLVGRRRRASRIKSSAEPPGQRRSEGAEPRRTAHSSPGERSHLLETEQQEQQSFLCLYALDWPHTAPHPTVWWDHVGSG